mgnify:CR=1 FL=1
MLDGAIEAHVGAWQLEAARAEMHGHGSRTEGYELVEDEEVDASAVDWCNWMFGLGHGAHMGDKLVAALGHYAPEFGRFGKRKLPRLWHG